MSDFKSLPGLDKAAILFSVLGEPLALTLFKDIKEDQIIKIRLRSKEMGVIDPLLRKEVLEDLKKKDPDLAKKYISIGEPQIRFKVNDYRPYHF